MKYEGMVQVTSNRQCLKQAFKCKYICNIISLFIRYIKPTRSEMIEGLTLSNMLCRIFSINTFNVICFRFCYHVYNRRVNNPLSPPSIFRIDYNMLETSDNYATRVLFNLSNKA